MNTIIRLKNIHLYGSHGVLSYEKKIKQSFEIDIEIYKNLSDAINSDNIEDTIDYRLIYDEVSKIFFSKQYNLIESLAHDIGRKLIDKFKIIKCKILIRKPDAPFRGNLDNVEVELLLNG